MKHRLIIAISFIMKSRPKLKEAILKFYKIFHMEQFKTFNFDALATVEGGIIVNGWISSLGRSYCLSGYRG